MNPSAAVINSWNKKLIGIHVPELDSAPHYAFTRSGNSDGTFGKPFQGWVSKKSALLRLPRCA